MSVQAPTGTSPQPDTAGMAGRSFASGAEVPWCNGCSYIRLNEKIQAVLARHYDPRDVVLVSDIGCIGIVDKLYSCHTVHGLHGRSVPLAAGLKLAHRNPRLKVVVFIGDGGCSIGLQHLIDAARLNAELTVLAFDNQNYGMTGGQHSTFTLPEVKTVTTPAGSAVPAMDLAGLLAPLPWVFRARLTAHDPRLPQAIEAALSHKGFAYLETLNFCSSHVGRKNPNLALARAQKFCEAYGREFGVWPGEERPVYALQPPPRADMAEQTPPALPVRFSHHLQGPLRIVIGGSAGGGVQTAAALFTRAAASCGLHFSLKSDYPVTVGKGHSTCEVILSPQPIHFAGIGRADLLLICSEDGRKALAPFVPTAERVVYDDTLTLERGTAMDFHAHGAKNAAFHALYLMLKASGWFPLEALRAMVHDLPDDKVKGPLLRILDTPDA